MNIIWAIIFLPAGLLLLFKSSQLLVTGAVSLAKCLGVSPLIIGLTVVAMGTSSPEVAASIVAAARGAGDIAIGNIYGSNIANLALVGGLCALVCPVVVRSQILRREIPVMLLTALLLWPVLANLHLSRPEGVVLLSLFAVLIMITVYMARRQARQEEGKQPQTQILTPETPNLQADSPLCTDDQKNHHRRIKKNVLYILVGLAGLALGADMTVRGAVFIGRRAGLSEAVIGLTIIAVGTSLPELVTCVVASLKRQHDIAIGNLVGSNVFNTLLVAGSAGVIQPFGIASRLIGVDYWVMIIVSAAFILMALIGRRISRIDGTLLLAGYLGYMVYLLAYSR